MIAVMDSKIAIVIVLYNEMPPSYVGSIDKAQVILVDNTPGRDLGIDMHCVTYLPLYKNLGIAKALNVGFKKAQEFSADWVLTMDQDSILPTNILSEFQKYIPHLDKPAVLAPQLNMYDGENKQPSDDYEELTEALTSGSLISMESWCESGGFREDLFIDGVDSEYCKHVRLLGYHVYQINSVVMQHQLGRTQEIKFFGKHLFYVTHHNYLRHYYMQRNSLEIARMYYGKLPENQSRISIPYKSILKIIFFEDNKLLKLWARYQGFCDYKKRKFGEYKGL